MAHVQRRTTKYGMRYEVRWRDRDGTHRQKSYRGIVTEREGGAAFGAIARSLSASGLLSPAGVWHQSSVRRLYASATSEQGRAAARLLKVIDDLRAEDAEVWNGEYPLPDNCRRGTRARCPEP